MTSTSQMEIEAEESSVSEETQLAEAAEVQEVVSLPLGAPAKQFYLDMFHSHEKFGGRKEGGGRDVIKVHGICKMCGKRVTGTDSYYLFKHHYQTTHAEALSLTIDDGNSRKRKSQDTEDDALLLAEGEREATLLLDIIPHESVDYLPFDRPEKDFFQQLYLGHEALPSTRRNGLGVYKYSGTCKRCMKKITGLGSVGIFKAHYKKNHNPAQLGSAEVAVAIDDTEGIEGTSTSVTLGQTPGKISSNGDFTAKHYFETMFSSHEVYKEPRGLDGSRGVSRFSGNCNLCSKKITGVDSFFNFRQHYYRAHEGAHIMSGLHEFIVIPNKRSVNNEEPTGEQKVSAKLYFQNMFNNHECSWTAADNKRGMKKRYTAVCKQCGKTVGGKDTFHNFQHHYHVYHANVEFNPAGGVDIEHVLNPPWSAEAEQQLKNVLQRARSNVLPSTDPLITKSKRPYGPDHPEQQKLDHNLALCIVQSLAPISVFTTPTFNKLLSDIDPNLTWPDRVSLKDKHLPSLHEHLRSSVLKNCKNSTAVSVTVWTKNVYMAVIVRLVDETWKMQNHVLMMKRCSDGTRFTQPALLKLSMVALVNFGIKDKISCVRELMGRDSDCQIILPPCLGSGESEIDDEGSCRRNRGGKDLREKIMDQCKMQPHKFKVHIIETLLDKSIDDAVKSSPTLLKALKKIVGNAEKNPPSGIENEKAVISSHWAATFRIIQESSKTGWEMSKVFKLTTAEQALLEEFVRVAESFEECFIKLEEFELPTLCDVIPFIYGLQKWLIAYGNEIEGLKDFIQQLSQEISVNFKEMDEDQLCVTATFLDPKYKLIWVKGSGAPNKADQVRKLILDQISDSGKTPGRTGTPLKRSSLLSFVNDNTSKNKVENTAEQEVQAYIDDEETSMNPLDYWRDNHSKFRRLAVLARSVFCVAASVTEDHLLVNVVQKDEILSNFDGDVDSLLFCHMNHEYDSH